MSLFNRRAVFAGLLIFIVLAACIATQAQPTITKQPFYVVDLEQKKLRYITVAYETGKEGFRTTIIIPHRTGVLTWMTKHKLQDIDLYEKLNELVELDVLPSEIAIDCTSTTGLRVKNRRLFVIKNYNYHYTQDEFNIMVANITNKYPGEID